MHRQYFTDDLPPALRDWVLANKESAKFRQKAVLAYSNSKWQLIGCTVEGLILAEGLPEPIESQRYKYALLHEEILSGDELVRFAIGIQQGDFSIGGIAVKRIANVHWGVERMAIDNEYMTKAGDVVDVQIDTVNATVLPLLEAGRPYYPDLYEAARDWLSLKSYYGHNDGRNGKVVFLLPETRAFFKSASFADKAKLELEVDGYCASDLELHVRGAYWVGKDIYQLNALVKNGRASLQLPFEAERFEYFLMDQQSEIYDFHRKDGRFGSTGHIKNPFGQQSVKQEIVKSACGSGEGMRIEFKPYIDPSDKFRQGDGQRSRGKTKLREMLESVAAFANTDGGRIFLGIGDDCSVLGMDDSLREYLKADLSEAGIEKYIGELRSRIKGAFSEELVVNMSHVSVDGKLVVMIEVEQSQPGPVVFLQEYHAYVRSGASDRRASPNEWVSIAARRAGPFGNVSGVLR